MATCLFGGLVTVSFLLGANRVEEDRLLLDAVVAARKCLPSSWDHLQLNCKFKVDTAAFEIAGVGADDAQFAVYAADPQCDRADKSGK